jgi:hypothetical protein
VSEIEDRLRSIAPTPTPVPAGLERRLWGAIADAPATNGTGHARPDHDVFWTTTVVTLEPAIGAAAGRRRRLQSLVGAGIVVAVAAVAVVALVSRGDLLAPTGTGDPGRIAAAGECLDAARMGRCFDWAAGGDGRYTFDAFTPQLTLTLPGGNHRNTAAFPDRIEIMDDQTNGTLEVYANVVPAERLSCSSTVRPTEIDALAAPLAYALAQRDNVVSTMPTGRAIAGLPGDSIALRPAPGRACGTSDVPLFGQSESGKPDRVVTLGEGESAVVTFLDTGLGTTLAVVERTLGSGAGTTAALDRIVRTFTFEPCIAGSGSGRCDHVQRTPDSRKGLGRTYVESSCPVEDRGACFEPFGPGRYSFTKFTPQFTLDVPSGWRNDGTWADMVQFSYPAIAQATVTFYNDVALDLPAGCRNDPGPSGTVIGAKATTAALTVMKGMGPFSFAGLPAYNTVFEGDYPLPHCQTPPGGWVILRSPGHRIALESPSLTTTVIIAGTTTGHLLAALIQAPRQTADQFWNRAMELYSTATLVPCDRYATAAGSCEPVFNRPSP